MKRMLAKLDHQLESLEEEGDAVEDEYPTASRKSPVSLSKFQSSQRSSPDQ